MDAAPIPEEFVEAVGMALLRGWTVALELAMLADLTWCALAFKVGAGLGGLVRGNRSKILGPGRGCCELDTAVA
jgi:hypothetical protein